MTTSPRSAFALGLTLGLFVAIAPSCTGGTTGGGTGGGTGGSGVGGGGGNSGVGGGAQSFCSEFAKTYCDYGIRCGFASPAARAECEAYVAPLYCGNGASITKGYTTIDNAQAGLCLASVADAGCNSPSLFSNEACAKVSSPNQNTGQGCFSSNDCKSATEGCGGASCMQTCGPTGGQGQPCPKSGPCGANLRCDFLTDTCIPPAAIGATCRYSNDCDATGYCDSLTEKCVALPTAGQTCRTSIPACTNGFYCGPGNTCQAKLALNVMCTSNGSCQDALFCDFTKTPDSCQTRLGNGATCPAGFDACASGLRCLGSVCQPPKAAGATCSGFNDCASELYCDDVLRTCQATVYDLVENQTCTGDTRNCGGGLVCQGAAVNPAGGMGTVGLCKVPKVGDACKSKFADECPDHAFCNLAVDGGPGTCVAASLGSPCSFTNHCLEGHYCEASLCAPKKAAGATCTGDLACVNPLTCITHPTTGAKTCGTLPDVGQMCAVTAGSNGCLFPYVCGPAGTCIHGGKMGEKCLSGGQCLSGKCDRDAGTCQTAGATGASCSSNFDCASTRCFRGTCEAVCP